MEKRKGGDRERRLGRGGAERNTGRILGESGNKCLALCVLMYCSCSRWRQPVVTCDWQLDELWICFKIRWLCVCVSVCTCTHVCSITGQPFIHYWHEVATVRWAGFQTQNFSWIGDNAIKKVTFLLSYCFKCLEWNIPLDLAIKPFHRDITSPLSLVIPQNFSLGLLYSIFPAAGHFEL